MLEIGVAFGSWFGGDVGFVWCWTRAVRDGSLSLTREQQKRV